MIVTRYTLSIMPDHSTLFLMTRDPAPAADIARICAAIGWRAVVGDTPEQATASVRDGACLLLIGADMPAPDISAAIAAVRVLPPFAAGVPILQCDPGLATHGSVRPLAAGLRDRIGLPLTRAGLDAAIEHWAGPVDDHAMRRTDNPRYRLIRLAGRATAEPMLARFADTLAQALAHPTIDPVEAHRVAGLAGMLGYADLSAAWSAVERRDTNAQAHARMASHSVLRALRPG